MKVFAGARALSFGAAIFVTVESAAVRAALAAEESLPAQAITFVENDQELVDAKVLESAFTDFGKGGFAALAPHVPALREALGHAPAIYPRVVTRGKEMIIHVDDRMTGRSDSALFLIGAAAGQKGVAGGGATATTVDNVYPIIALILGSYANEMKQYEEALGYLDRGHAMQPEDPLVVLERASALNALHRQAEAAASLKAYLESGDTLLAFHRASVMRNLGVALIDLDRLDEAEAMLKDSIKADSDNPIARQELEYIKKLRAGARPTSIQLQTRKQYDEEQAAKGSQSPR